MPDKETDVLDKKADIRPPNPYLDMAATTGGRRCRVLLADDHEMLLDMLRNLLEPEFEVVGTATDGVALVAIAQRLRPDIAVIDVVMPVLSGLDAGRQLSVCAPTVKLVYLTMEADETLAAEAFASGASAYLLKASSTVELQQAMRMVANGGRYLTPAIANGDLDALCEVHPANPLTRLSPREVEVLKLLVSGRPMKSVARQLGITARTVAFHKYRAMAQLGLQGNTELIEFSIRHGLLGIKGTTARPGAQNNRPRDHGHAQG